MSSAERKAVEQRAMEVVSKEMKKKQGWKVEDVHKEKNRGYDFIFKNRRNLFIVKLKEHKIQMQKLY